MQVGSWDIEALSFAWLFFVSYMCEWVIDHIKITIIVVRYVIVF